MELRIANEYRLGRKIGAGSFGDLYMGTNVHTGEEYAIKLESTKAMHPQLQYESRVYRILCGGIGIPFVKWFGTEGKYNIMVLELLGPSLEDLFNYCSRKFSLKTVLMLADQMISRIEYCHHKNFIHRDIKPDNFLMGVNKRSHQVYIIDFGLAKKYREPRTHTHIPFREHKNLTGTARYASCNAHAGKEQSRRDDLESLGYIMMYFNRGSLPWQGLKAATRKQKYERISEKKMNTPLSELCKNFPSEFETYLYYCQTRRFDEKPDYSYLRQLFRNLFYREHFTYDYFFDWSILKAKQQGSKKTGQSQDWEGVKEQNKSGPPRPKPSAAVGSKEVIASSSNRRSSATKVPHASTSKQDGKGTTSKLASKDKPKGKEKEKSKTSFFFGLKRKDKDKTKK
eukprot:Nk52_evm6s1444 gene=Nk52_evmTU6s1444